MIQAAFDNVLVKVKHTATKPMSDVMRLSSIQDNTSIDISDYITIIGEVVSLPKRISDKREYKGFSTKDIEIGDTAIFSYLVIGDMKVLEGNEYTHKNELFYNGNKYFIADITRVFGVIRDEEIIMINGYVMLQHFKPSGIILPQHMRSLKQATSSEVMYIGNSKTTEKGINLKYGDKVYFNPFTAQHYKINDKKFVIVSQDKILGKEVTK